MNAGWEGVVWIRRIEVNPGFPAGCSHCGETAGEDKALRQWARASSPRITPARRQEGHPPGTSKPGLEVTKGKHGVEGEFTQPSEDLASVRLDLTGVIGTSGYP